ncbi:DUF2017 family protein [Microbacterium horticulturae]|uniref:DUF2017 family protein n=1 Tax=Microbacterium horticulturae TaxID=3028316 RepID=A0ABY8C4N8_9MICO|nr:DUF2017 family protein [Microbacterium sp. KACC 23027]WEG10282.1 DUF2017 family protein [Microbacterium sp. KACC 23027]
MTVVQITRIEAANLAELLRQFRELMDAADNADPAVQRLTPDAYPDDTEASRQFRDLTASDLLSRRQEDAQTVLETLGVPFEMPRTDTESLEEVTIALSPEQFEAWLRSLAALRLVLASRLGVSDEDDHDEDDPRFGVYDWLGYRLEMLVQQA